MEENQKTAVEKNFEVKIREELQEFQQQMAGKPSAGKMLFLYNPISGKGMIRLHLSEIVNTFVGAGYEVRIHATQGKEDAVWMTASEAAHYDLIVASGGDGTLNEVVKGLLAAKAQTPVGYIPTGSTNDFARSLKIPLRPVRAAQLVVSGKARRCDVQVFNGETFIYVAAFGMFSDVSYQTDQKLKNKFGHAAYVFEGVKSAQNFIPYPMEVRANGEVTKGEFIFGVVSNSDSIGGIKHIAGNTCIPDDGMFEVAFIRMPENPMQLNDILTNLAVPKHCDSRYIFKVRTDRLEIHSSIPVPWTLDGEYGGDQTDVVVTSLKQVITLILP